MGKAVKLFGGSEEDKLKLAPDGWVFLGRDEAWGDEFTGLVAIDPDEEYKQGKPYYRDTKFDAKNDIIHLQIASFRDRLCPRTLYNLFHKAANPKRIFVRILQQIQYESEADDDGDCWKNFCLNYKDKLDCVQFEDQVKVLTVEAESARGPTDPRSKLSAMVEYDYLHPTDPILKTVHATDYCMQTDSHMDFNQDFDVGLVEMFHRTKNDYAVLSTYVAAMEQTDTNPHEVPHLCMVHYTSTWRNWGTKYVKNLKRPKLTNLPWGAGLSFSRCHAELNVPYDPYLPNVFDGEEISRGFRFFTFGYDMYTPDQVLVTHDYKGHQSNPNVHTWGRGHHSLSGDTSKVERRHARHALYDDDLHLLAKVMGRIEAQRPHVSPTGVNRINLLLGMGLKYERAKKDLDIVTWSRYGLGTRRNTIEATDFSGFDPQKKKMTANRCGNLQWSLFNDYEEGNYGLDSALGRPIWNEEPGSTLAPVAAPVKKAPVKPPTDAPTGAPVAVVAAKQHKTLLKRNSAVVDSEYSAEDAAAGLPPNHVQNSRFMRSRHAIASKAAGGSSFTPIWALAALAFGLVLARRNQKLCKRQKTARMVV